MLIINKMDTEGANEKYLEIKNQLENLDGRLLVFFNIVVLKVYMYNYFFSDAIVPYSDEIKPSRAIKFDKILKISAKDQPDDVQRVKSTVRELLDVNEELNNNIEYKSLKNIKEQLRERGPVLI